jgi:hypothetical protein
MRRPLAFLVLSLALVLPLAADENPHHDPDGRTRHYVLTPAHALSREEQAALRARGVAFVQTLTNGRYLVRIHGDAAPVEDDPSVAMLAPYTAASKVEHGAYAAAAQGKTYSRLTVRFHDDVSLDDARAAVAAAGGALESPFEVAFDAPKELTVRVASASLPVLAADERVLLVGAPPRRKVMHNAVAAVQSEVTPLYAAPYGLSGQGVVLSIFELGPPDASHPEFGGRLISHFTGGSNSSHATHTSGTMIAAGNNAPAKGMSPAARLEAFDASADTPAVFALKQTTVPQTGSVADNNSWGFCLGWQPPDTNCSNGQLVWYGCPECLGGYDGLFVGPLDKIARGSSTLYVHSSGNDGFNGLPDFTPPWSPHKHIDDNSGDIGTATFCYSQNGSGTDCPVPTCSAGASHCEITKHPTWNSFTTLGLSASGKNIVSVGAVDQFNNIAPFSSRGPAQDGRVKPELVAKGVHQYSTVPNGLYGYNQGTSMASPVVAGISGLVVEQWRKTFGGASPTPQQLKTLLIAGAKDLGTPGPDYIYGFGLVDAKGAVDLIRNDGLRNGTLARGESKAYTLTLTTAQPLRVVLAWSDPEVFGLTEDDMAGKTLVNDLDVKVTDPSGNTVLPYVLDMKHPDVAATRGVNSIDNIEEVEMAGAPAGTYRVTVTARAIGDTTSSTQAYVLTATSVLTPAGPVAPPPAAGPKRRAVGH